MKIIYPELSYAKTLELSRLLTLCDRTDTIVAKLFNEIWLINLTVSTNYFQVNTKATLWEKKNTYSSKV